MADLYERLDLRRVINAAGTLTAYGQSSAHPDAVAAMAEALPLFFEMDALHARASRTIARVTGAEAGFVTGCAAAGITIGVAACLAGTDPAKIAQLPDTLGMRDEVLIQMGHCVDYGAPVTQGIRLAGAQARVVGTVNGTSRSLFDSSFTGRTAAAVYVVSHHTTPYGCIPLPAFVETARRRGVPVLVDAAAEETQLQGILAAGADLVVCSGHKHFRGPTSGVVMGRLDLIRACYAQNRGIGRHMKVGKEGIVGLIAALEAWERGERERDAAAETARVERMVAGLQGIVGLSATTLPAEPDPLPIARAKVALDPAVAGLDAKALTLLLARGEPGIRVRAHHADEGYFLLDPFTLTDLEAEEIVAAIRTELARPASEKKAAADEVAGLSMADLWARAGDWPYR